MKRGMLRHALLILAAGVVFSPAFAQAEPSASDRETARALVLDGRAKLAAKDYQGALKAFQAAHEIMSVPTTGLDLARAEEALGMLIEARTTALEVARMPAKPREPGAFTAARPTAAKLAEQLAGRIPALLITVKGADPGASVRVTVDGAAVSPSTLSLPRKVNPGAHELTASAPGYTTGRLEVTLKDGETRPVELTLTRPTSKQAAPALQMTPDQAPSPGPESPAPGGKLGGAPTWAWVAGSAGLAALGVGIGFAVDYTNARRTVTTDCPGNVCSGDQYSLEAAQALRGRWNRDLGLFVGFSAAGAIGVGAAVAGIFGFVGKRRTEQASLMKSAAISPWLSPGAAGAWVHGAF